MLVTWLATQQLVLCKAERIVFSPRLALFDISCLMSVSTHAFEISVDRGLQLIMYHSDCV